MNEWIKFIAVLYHRKHVLQHNLKSSFRRSLRRDKRKESGSIDLKVEGNLKLDFVWYTFFQACATPAGVFVSDKAAASLLVAIGRDIFKNDITWGKIVSVFAVAGGLAVDCVCQGHPEYLHGLVEGVADLLEDEVAEWIAGNGGWVIITWGFSTKFPRNYQNLANKIILRKTLFKFSI